MDTMTGLFVANACVWLGLCAYIFFVARTQSAVQKRLAQMEALEQNEHE